MLEGFACGIITAWILSWFGADVMLIEAIQPFVNGVVLTNTHYYAVFAIFGLITGIGRYRND